jgi:hypothetical protein
MFTCVYMYMYVCVCVCVRARARARVHLFFLPLTFWFTHTHTQVNTTLNAVVAERFEASLLEAAQADERLARARSDGQVFFFSKTSSG